ncbi:hypothetical protein AHAS_Ahas01G0284200 [Arachis hypogaea]
MPTNSTGNTGYSTRPTAVTTPKIIEFKPIAVPSLSLDELKSLTDNFGAKCFIGEGAYGKVYRATLKDGRDVVIKKLDSSRQPDQEFLAQVQFNAVSISMIHNIANYQLFLYVEYP